MKPEIDPYDVRLTANEREILLALEKKRAYYASYPGYDRKREAQGVVRAMEIVWSVVMGWPTVQQTDLGPL